MYDLSNLSPFKIILVCCIGIVFGVAIIMYGANSTAESILFVDTPQFLIWLFFIIVQTALWALLLFPLTKSLTYFKDAFAHNKGRILLPTIMLVLPLFAYIMAYDPTEPMFAYLREKVITLTIIGYCIALLAVIGVWLVQIVLTNEFGNNEVIVDEKGIMLFLDLHNYLKRFLGIAGIMVGMATLSTGALSNARKVIEPIIDSPSEIAVIYGAFFSGILAIAYIPAYLTLQAKGHLICETIFPMPSPKSAQWDKWYSKRRALEKILKLEINAKDNFEAGVSILAPLFGAVISLLLGN